MSDLLQMGVLSAIAVATGLVGPFLILKRMAMFANSLSHTILLGIAIAFLVTGGPLFSLPNLLIGALLAALMTAFLTEGLVRFFRLQEDASIGLIFTALFAAGITLVTLFMRDVHLGIEAVMGNVELLQFADLKLSLSLVGLNLVAILLFYKQFQLSSFDRSLAKTLGVPCGVFHFLLLFLVATTCIGAFRAVGVLLVLAFLVGPFLTARLFCHRLPWLLFWTPLVGIFASVAGVLLSRLCFDLFGLPLSTGGIVATLIGLIYVVARCMTKINLFTPVPESANLEGNS
ncbi:MAG TPA: metal ABC transporter permease [Chlamydiales bacterium]|nr:metal ABC transporter permease [Chlamydiales bacterium]